jgi:NAD(P)H-flavin reductase
MVKKMKQFLSCRLIQNARINDGFFRLDFSWPGSVPRAGQFFMIKPKRSAVFLPRPYSVSLWKENLVGFLIQIKAQGTKELASMQNGEEAELTGPLGNAWIDFLPAVSGSKIRGLKPIALIGGGAGIAPLQALCAELPKGSFDFYAGFKKSFCSIEEKIMLLGQALANPPQLIISAEEIDGDGVNSDIHSGRIPDFLDPANYAAVCACGPQAMLRAVAEKCAAAETPCYVSLERHMACGVGACLGCTVSTVNGNRRCCADGPVFSAGEVFF